MMQWQRTLGGSAFDAAESIISTSDGGFLICGNSKSDDIDLTDNAGENDLWLIKTDDEGNIVWQRAMGGSDLDYGFDALETDNGALIMVGEASSVDFPQIESKGSVDAVVVQIR